MSRTTAHLLKAALSALHYSGAGRVAAPYTAGAGVIFMLHHVRPEPPEAFEPNRILKVTPAFLEAVIEQVLDAGFDIVSLDEVHRRLEGPRDDRPFACFTLDDGYRDNRDFAYPIFKRHNLPFAIYVPTDYPDGRGDLWWLVLETVVRRSPEIQIQMAGRLRHLSTATTADKDAAFAEIYWWLRRIPEHRARAVVGELAASIGYDPAGLCGELILSWDEIRSLAEDPLVTFGAHTRKHLALAKLPDREAYGEIAESIQRLEAELQRPCHHFSYPYGCEKSVGSREFEIARGLGVKTAVTTRKGLIYGHHRHALTALPRLSLNGDFQDGRYVKVLLTGAPFAVWNAMRGH